MESIMKVLYRLPVLVALLVLMNLGKAQAGFFDRYVAPGQTLTQKATEVTVTTTSVVLIESTDTNRIDTYIINTSTWPTRIVIATSAVTCTTAPANATTIGAGAAAYVLDIPTSTTIGAFGANANAYMDIGLLQYVGPWYAIALTSTSTGVDPVNFPFAGKVKVIKQNP